MLKKTDEYAETGGRSNAEETLMNSWAETLKEVIAKLEDDTDFVVRKQETGEALSENKARAVAATVAAALINQLNSIDDVLKDPSARLSNIGITTGDFPSAGGGGGLHTHMNLGQGGSRNRNEQRQTVLPAHTEYMSIGNGFIKIARELLPEAETGLVQPGEFVIIFYKSPDYGDLILEGYSFTGTLVQRIAERTEETVYDDDNNAYDTDTKFS